MNKDTQIKTTGALYSFIRAVVYLVSAWQLKKSGGHPDDSVVDWMTGLILPVVAPVAAFIWAQYQLHHRTNSAALKIDTALELPSGTTNSQLNAVVERLKPEIAKTPSMPLSVLVDEVSKG